ncbi:MAG: hypothetical protein AAGI37_11275 [Planctomycetota bacterium]
MRRWKLVTVLALGVLWMLACEERAERSAEVAVGADSPVAGVWYLQSEGEGRPVAGDVDVRFAFLAQGLATYERSKGGPEGPLAFELRYNLLDQIISIDSNSDDPAVPRITGRIDLSGDGETLRIRTHSDAVWVLTRDARPGGDLEAARAAVESDADPMLIRVQHLVYAVGRYRQTFGAPPGHLSDLVDAGLVSAAALNASGHADALPARYPRMTSQERANWLDGHSAFVLLGQAAGDAHTEHVWVSTLPADHKAVVIVGMSTGAVYEKSGKEAAALILQQEGSLPERWPGLGWSEDAAAGLEPLSD